MTLEEKYLELCNTPSDINEHLPVLRKYAEKCQHVTEFGFRWGCSTYALLAARPLRLISYDIVSDWGVEQVFQYAIKENLNFYFHHKDVLKIEIAPTDLLFIDTFHSSDQCMEELRLHADKVKKYLIFHDTVLFWEHGMDRLNNGLRYAIEPFMANNPQWKEVYRAENNNGLLILEKQC